MEYQIRPEQQSSNLSVSTAVIESIAEAEGVDTTELPPLYERIDPEALDVLFAPRMGGKPRTGTIEFHYYGYAVTVVCDDGAEITLESE